MNLEPLAWADLIRLFKVLNDTPPEQLETALAPILDVDATLKFLAVDVALVNSDGFWTRASDYSIYVHEIAEKWLDWKKLEPIVRARQALIAEDVKTDTQKLYSTEAFAADVSGTENSLQAFVEKRRAFLVEMTGGLRSQTHGRVAGLRPRADRAARA